LKLFWNWALLDALLLSGKSLVDTVENFSSNLKNAKVKNKIDEAFEKMVAEFGKVQFHLDGYVFYSSTKEWHYLVMVGRALSMYYTQINAFLSMQSRSQGGESSSSSANANSNIITNPSAKIENILARMNQVLENAPIYSDETFYLLSPQFSEILSDENEGLRIIMEYIDECIQENQIIINALELEMTGNDGIEILGEYLKEMIEKLTKDWEEVVTEMKREFPKIAHEILDMKKVEMGLLKTYVNGKKGIAQIINEVNQISRNGRN
jgi:hypothetical protein